MATEAFLINPPKRLRRKVKARRGRRSNPIGETLITIGANPSRSNPMRRIKRSNPWYGDSSGHRIAALMRWGQLPKGKVGSHRKRRRVKHRRVVKHVRKVSTKGVRMRHRKRVDRRTKSYRLSAVKQRRQAISFLGMTSGRKAKFKFKSGEGWIKRRSNSIGRYGMATRRKRRKSSRHRNTWFKQPRRHRRAARKGWRRGHMLVSGSRRHRVRHNNPMVGGVATNPRRKRHYNVRHRRSYRGRRRNPAIMAEFNKFSSSLMNVRHWVPLAVTGGLSAITGAVVPGMLGVNNPWAKYGVQTAVAFGGSIVVERVAGREHGQAWMIVGIAMVGYQLLKDFVLVPYFPQFAVGLGAEPGQYENFYPGNNIDDVSQRIDAFPNMHAFPNAINDYPGVGVSAYPYDGAGY